VIYCTNMYILKMIQMFALDKIVRQRSAEQLMKLRAYLIESIVQASDQVAAVDKQLAVLQSAGLEADLIQAEESART